MNDNEQPLELSAELRSEAMALFAPMDHSVACSVTASICMRRSRRRLLQGLWLGLSPVMAVAIVAVLYTGGALLPRWLSSATSQRAFMSATPPIAVADNAISKGTAGSESVSALARVPSSRIVLDGDVARRRLLVTWLRARHADVAAELDNALPGQDIFLTLEPDEVQGFSTLMTLNGFVGQEPSGLRTVPRYSLTSWASSLEASSLSVCIVP